MQNPFQPPYLGAAYYPEDWDEREIDYDISMMKKAGITIARIAEFAWHKMEPAPGEYDFAWLHRVVDRLKEAGIAVVLGTPTATPPQWLMRMYPDVAMEMENGRRKAHGGRRHCCSNNPHFREASRQIVTRMAREFGKDDGVAGWQIDNEIYISDMNKGCFCPECRAKFAQFLRQKYGTIEALNERWNLNLFSQAYDRFEDVSLPRDAWHNPHLKMDWLNFQSESHIDFVHMQAEILHRYVSVPVGTDTMPFNGMNYRHMTEALDVVQFNHYNTPDNLWHACLWFDYLRTMRPHPFWNTETQTCWNGSVSIGQGIKPEGYCRVNSFLPIALGGEANIYWIWRTHWAGHELTHGSVLDASGRPMHIFGEVQQTAEMLRNAGSFLNRTKVDTRVAMHYSSLNWNMMTTQPVVDQMNTGWINHFYEPLIRLGLRPDVIDAKEPLEKYDLVVSPLMMTLEEDGLPERIGEWVKNGGTWIAGPLTDIRNEDGARYRHKPFGILEELTHATWCYGIPDPEGRISAAWADGTPFEGQLWYDLFEADEHALVSITGGHSAINGKACVLDIPVGQGHVILLGTIPTTDELTALYRAGCEHAGIPCGKTTGSVMVSPRKGGEEGVILCEYGNAEASYRFEGETMTDLLTGKTYRDGVDLQPYEIMILQKTKGETQQ